MTSLLALDFELGPDLEQAIRESVDASVAFCVLERRTSPRRRLEDLERLGATAVRDANGVTELANGTPVDDEIGLVMLTSGSGGEPKAAELTWSALRASAELTQATLRGDLPPVWLPCLPASHIGGLAVLLRAILSDATLLWGEGENLESGAAHGATHVSVVRPQLARHDVSGFHHVLLGGARPPTALPENVISTWGMTETGSGVVYDGVALPGVDVASIDGEICVRTPTLFRSYRSEPRPTVRGPDGRDDWFPTGDAGDVTDGIVTVRGRLGFLINTGGEKLWPEELETALATIEGVHDVAVTSVDDPEWGQRVVALIVSDGSRLDESVRGVAEERIGPWAKPKEIRYVVAIPRTGNGKIRRSDLPNVS
ncbi:MAG TPA: AMP-binding protein [Acidimicrobiales bacterium]|nr:AMP-binding protein [Acidimicrobiales bacterium]